jgi:hypothetical protein
VSCWGTTLRRVLQLNLLASGSRNPCIFISSNPKCLPFPLAKPDTTLRISVGPGNYLRLGLRSGDKGLNCGKCALRCREKQRVLSTGRCGLNSGKRSEISCVWIPAWGWDRDWHDQGMQNTQCIGPSLSADCFDCFVSSQNPRDICPLFPPQAFPCSGQHCQSASSVRGPSAGWFMDSAGKSSLREVSTLAPLQGLHVENTGRISAQH